MLKQHHGLKVRFGILFLSVIIVFCGILSIIMYNVIKHEATIAILEKVKGDLASGEQLIDAWCPGPWRVEGDLLYKGDTLINDNFALVDKIGQLTGNTATIFLGNTRIATNVKNPDGSRAVGTQVSEVVEKTVLQQGQEYYGEADVVGTPYQTAYKPLLDSQGNIVGIWYVGASKAFEQAMIKSSMMYIIGGSIVIAGLGILALIFFTNRIVVKPINHIMDCADKIAQGDLRVQAADNLTGEFARLATAFNGMATSLQQMMHRMRNYSNDLAANGQELSAVAEEVSATMESVSATSHELTDAARRDSQNAATAAEAAQAVYQKAESAGQAGQQAISKINNMQATVQQGTEAVKNLRDKSGHIEQIVVTIGGIAEQTNLLALNAAIEAARAGEQGRGFAVVAEEVRKLAEESAAATKKIADIIKVIQQDTNNAAEVMIKGTEEIVEGVKLIEEIGRDIIEIQQQAQVSAQLAQQMSESSEQNSTNIQALSESTEQTSTAMQQVAASSQMLGQLADDLNNIVSQYKL